MRYGRIFDYRNRNEAEIGKRYVFTDLLKIICETPESHTVEGVLTDVDDDSYPFEKDNDFSYPFIREVIDEPELMTNRQLSELIAKGYGEWRHMGDEMIHAETCYDADKMDDAVETVLVRPWSSLEWRLPTVDIYNDFCHPKCKEDS